MSTATVTARRVRDDDATFWHLECDTCDFEGYQYEAVDVQDAIDAHAAEHEETNQ